MTSSIYNEKEFWKAFLLDMLGARARVIIQSPFVSAFRLKLLADAFQELSRRNIPTCIFVQEQSSWNDEALGLTPQNTYSQKETRLAFEMLQSWGAHINLKTKIHRKLAVIDGQVLWEGSLNILSHYNGLEHMRRWDNANEVGSIISKYSLDDCWECQENFLKSGIVLQDTQSPAAFGKAILARRTYLNLSLRQLERLTGIPRTSISRMESGEADSFRAVIHLFGQMKVTNVTIPDELLPLVVQTVRRAAGQSGVK
jgi:hypothetical protein